MPEELVIGFNPMPAAQRVAASASQIRSRLVWLAVSAVICLSIYLVQRHSMSNSLVVWLFIAGLGYSAIWVIMAIVNWARAKAGLGKVAPTVAGRIDRQGVWLVGLGLAWENIRQIVARPQLFQTSPLLRVVAVDGRSVQVPLDTLNVLPATIDSSIRAFSGGRQWIDTSKLGN